MEEIKYTVSGLINKDAQQITLVTNMNFKEMQEEIARRVINIQEQVIREGLIKLGWTPPQEEKKL